MPEKPAITRLPIDPLIARRWSARAIDPDRPVERDRLIALLEAARWAPSCNGDEPWRYLVWDRWRDADSWQRALGCLTERNRFWAKNAPVLLLAASASRFEQTGKPNRWGRYDTGAASENLCLQASALGLVAHQMGGFDAEQLRREFAVPEEFACMAMIAVGHPGPLELLDEDYRKKELAARRRAALATRFFEGAWGSPVAPD